MIMSKIYLNKYEQEPSLIIGKLEVNSECDYRLEYQGSDYLVNVRIDLENVPVICLYELDDKTVKYIGDTEENLFLVFEKTVITEKELIEYCNKHLMKWMNNA